LYGAFLAADGFARRAAAAIVSIENAASLQSRANLTTFCRLGQIITTVDLRQVFLISRRAVVTGYRRLCWMLLSLSLKVGLPDIVWAAREGPKQVLFPTARPLTVSLGKKASNCAGVVGF
jgi:hypothetical protein